MQYAEYYIQFFTATILEWKQLLIQDKYKDIIVESLRCLVKEQRIKIHAFVIMNNHLHLMWQVQPGNKREQVQRDFLKFTAQQIKSDLSVHHPKVLEHFYVNAADRKYQIWARNTLGIDLFTHAVFLQKLEYIHWNPGKAGLCNLPEGYRYSSANFYLSGVDNFGFLTHLNE